MFFKVPRYGWAASGARNPPTCLLSPIPRCCRPAAFGAGIQSSPPWVTGNFSIISIPSRGIRPTRTSWPNRMPPYTPSSSASSCRAPRSRAASCSYKPLPYFRTRSKGRRISLRPGHLLRRRPHRPPPLRVLNPRRPQRHRQRLSPRSSRPSSLRPPPRLPLLLNTIPLEINTYIITKYLFLKTSV